MNPCRCGGGGEGQCRKGPRCAEQYQSRLSGPFIDRIDLFFDTPAVTAMDLTLPAPSEGSADVAVRVDAARQRQAARYAMAEAHGRRALNVDATGEELTTFAAPDAAGQALISEAASAFNLSARAYHRVLKVARTIADLEASDQVRRIHVAEALSYRRRPPQAETTARAGALAQ